MFDWFEKQKAFYQILGPARFIGLYVILITYIGMVVWLHDWLSDEAGWPEAYGFQCRGRGCLYTEMAHSFALLKNGAAHEVALFALLWHLPVLTVIIVTIVLARRKLKSHRNRIRPMEY